jgi:hypothetical protein
MTTLEVTVTLPVELLVRAKRAVRLRRARSLSAFVCEAVAEKLCRDDLEAVLARMDGEDGKPSREARAWARRVLSR